jgi:hypothetical protein
VATAVSAINFFTVLLLIFSLERHEATRRSTTRCVVAYPNERWMGEEVAMFMKQKGKYLAVATLMNKGSS